MKPTLTIYCWLFDFLTVYSSNMGFVLVFPLILAFLSIGQSYTDDVKQKTNSCSKACPAGYHKVCDCGDQPGMIRCKKCGNARYTERENAVPECLRCDTCGNYEVEIKPCSFNSNVVCDCKKGYYNANSGGYSNCKRCKELDNSDPERKCEACQRTECLEVPECKKCKESALLPPSNMFDVTPSTSTSTPTSTSAAIFVATKSITSNNTSNPTSILIPNGQSWMFLIMSLVTLMGAFLAFLVFFLLWLLFVRRSLRQTNNCLCWSVNKDEQSRHQGSSPNTQAFNISEETPMMTHSPDTPNPPAHTSPPLPDDEHQVATQDEQSEHWPAIVLYAIIKEVPLRRWKEFLRLLSVTDQQLERVELEAGLGLSSMERQYQMLRLWSQRSSASLDDVFSALHYMDLSGCAQLLQERLEKLQWRPEEGFTACGSYTDHGLDGCRTHEAGHRHHTFLQQEISVLHL